MKLYKRKKSRKPSKSEMAAPKGNQFWKQRSKHGRDKLFQTPQALWEAACEYFEATDQRKWTKKDWVGKDAIEVERKTDTPYTLTGLCLYLDCDISYFRKFEENQNSKDFIPIITRIKQIIYTQKFEGAAVGAYNANIIARELGLKEQTENTQAIVLPDIPEEQLKKLKDDFNSKY